MSNFKIRRYVWAIGVVIYTTIALSTPIILSNYCSEALPAAEVSQNISIQISPKVQNPEAKAEQKRCRDNKYHQQHRFLCSLAAETSDKAVATSDHAEKRSGEETSWGKRFVCETRASDYSIALFTLGLLIATVLLWRSTEKLWFSTDSLVEGAEETAKRQLRAYIAIDDATFEYITDDRYTGFTGRIIFRLKNFGLTPAKEVVIKADTEIGAAKPRDFEIPISDTIEKFPTFTVPPGHTRTALVSCKTPELVREGWHRLATKEKKGYLWGRIDYIDAFNRKRFIKFQMICDFGLITTFSFCEAGNEEDND